MELFLKVFVFIGVFLNCLCQHGFRFSDKRNVRLPSRNQGRATSNLQAFLRASSDGFLSQSEIERFTPGTPAPDEVECYVDIDKCRTERVGGRCVMFGRTNIRVCQAGGYTGNLFNNRQCQSLPLGGSPP